MEHFRASTHAREAVHDAALAADRDGDARRPARRLPHRRRRLQLAVRPAACSRASCCPGRTGSATRRSTGAWCSRTRRRWAPYRGYGQPESNFVREVLVDRARAPARLDPVELRRRTSSAPRTCPGRTSAGAHLRQRRLPARSTWRCRASATRTFRARQAECRRAGRYVGVGVSCFVEMTGYPSSAFLGKHGARFGAFESVTHPHGPRRARRALHRRLDVRAGDRDHVRADCAASVLGIDPARRRGPPRRHAGHAVQRGRLREPHDDRGRGRRPEGGRARSAPRCCASPAISSASTPTALEVAAAACAPPRRSLRADLPSPRWPTAAFFAHRCPPGEAPGLEATAYFDPPASAFGYGTAAAHRRGEPAHRRVPDRALPPRARLRHPGESDDRRGPAPRRASRRRSGPRCSRSWSTTAPPGSSSTARCSTTSCRRRPTCRRFELDHTETPSPVTTFGVRASARAGPSAPPPRWPTPLRRARARSASRSTGCPSRRSRSGVPSPRDADEICRRLEFSRTPARRPALWGLRGQVSLDALYIAGEQIEDHADRRQHFGVVEPFVLVHQSIAKACGGSQ